MDEIASFSRDNDSDNNTSKEFPEYVSHISQRKQSKLNHTDKNICLIYERAPTKTWPEYCFFLSIKLFNFNP